jgi:hypothetical protein
MRAAVPMPALARVARLTAALVVSGGLFTGCGGTTLSIPRPTDELQPAPPPPVLEPSLLGFEVDLPLTRLRALADDAVPHALGRPEAWVGLGRAGLEVQYQAWREDVDFEMVGDRLVTRLDLRYRLRGRLAGGPVLGECGYGGEGPPGVRVVAASALAWTPWWGLRSTTALEPPAFLGPCKALPGGLDVTPYLPPVLAPGLEPLARAVDARVGQLAPARERVALLWERLAAPVEVTPGTWLALRPRAARAGPIVAAGPGVVRTTVQVVAEPMAKLDGQPDPETRPLPDLEPLATPAPAFHIALPFRVPYAALNERLAETMVGASVDVGMSRPLSVVEIQAYGSGAKVILEVGVTGPARGLVYLAGTPALDLESQTLRLDGLQFSVDSDSALVRTTGRLLHRRLVSALESRARLPLGVRVEALRSRLGAALNRELAPGVELTGTVDRLQLRDVYPVEGGLEVVAVFDGALRLVGR